MEIALGRLRRLQQCATPGGHFVILAMDHRGNLRRSLNPTAPDSVTYEAMVRTKLEVTGALASHASAVLLDPEYGAAQAVAAGVLPGRTGLIVAVEQTGYEGHTTARESQVLPGWSVEKTARMGASGVKLLLYYHPQAPNAEEQEALVQQVASSCRQLEIPLFLEPLSFSLNAGVKTLTSGEKRRVVVETARRLTPLGADVLKAEFPLNTREVADEGLWSEACAQLSAASSIPWVVLSAGVSFDEFARQTSVACRAGASGVMAGRAVWQEAAALTGAARSRFLNETARERMDLLSSAIAEHARPWMSFLSPQDFEEGWYVAY